MILNNKIPDTLTMTDIFESLQYIINHEQEETTKTEQKRKKQLSICNALINISKQLYLDKEINIKCNAAYCRNKAEYIAKQMNQYWFLCEKHIQDNTINQIQPIPISDILNLFDEHTTHY